MAEVLDKEACCTIITEDYLHYALSLRDSLGKNSHNQRRFFVLISIPYSNRRLDLEDDSCEFLYIEDLCKDGEGKLIFDKYYGRNMDCFRWSMKPVLLNYLIKHKDIEKVLFLDSDLYFFNNYDFLFASLNDSSIVLTPHWRSSTPGKNAEDFQILMPHGIFNAGFVGINSTATDALTWWAKACEHACEIDAERGIYVDQGHLNALPVLFDKVEILKHQGCNVAEWNIKECKRDVINGQILINEKYPIIFIHFTTRTVKRIADGRDPYLISHLAEYSLNLDRYSKGFNILAKASKNEPEIEVREVYVGFINRMVNKFRIGTIINRIRTL